LKRKLEKLHSRDIEKVQNSAKHRIQHETIKTITALALI